MKIYLGFDDTDTNDSLYGTGKVVRWFQKAMPTECVCQGVVRQQLLVCDEIPYTSHNSAACLIAEMPDPSFLRVVIERAVSHIKKYALDGSDPGLCVTTERDVSIDRLIDFGYYCTRAVATQKQALQVASQIHLSGHGGTNDGIIGATAAVGLTISGWSGRFIEYGNLRSYPDEVLVSEISSKGIQVMAMDRDAPVPAPNDTVLTNGWLRPRLMGHRPVLFVQSKSPGIWENMYWKRKKLKTDSLSPKPVAANT